MPIECILRNYLAQIVVLLALPPTALDCSHSFIQIYYWHLSTHIPLRLQQYSAADDKMTHFLSWTKVRDNIICSRGHGRIEEVMKELQYELSSRIMHYMIYY
jgi:hypothetical protein